MDPSIEHLKASDGSANASLATVQSTRSGGASTISVDTVSGIPDFFCASMGTPHTFTDPITSETITVIDESTAVDFAGHVDGTNLEIDDIAPGYTDGGSEVGDIIIIRPTTQYADNLAAILGAAHRNDGELNATVIYDANDNEVAEFESVTSAVNNIGFVNAATGNPAIIKAKGGDTNIGIELTPKGTGDITKNGNNIDWWEEIGRTTLGSAGDTIDVTSLPARKFIKIIFSAVATGGTLVTALTFNNDTGSNYTSRYSDNGAADSTVTSGTSIVFRLGTVPSGGNTFNCAELSNISSVEKVGSYFCVGTVTATGAGTAPSRLEGAFKWANTSNQISSVKVTNSGTGDFAIGSVVVVLGHD